MGPLGPQEELAALNAEVTQDVARLFKDPLTDVDLVLDHTVPVEARWLGRTGGAREFAFVDHGGARCRQRRTLQRSTGRRRSQARG